MKTKSSQDGFTSIELVCSVIIIVIFATVAIARVADLKSSAETAQCKQNQYAIITACMMYEGVGENARIGTPPERIEDLVPKYLDKEPECPTAGKYGYNPANTTIRCARHSL